MVKNPSQVDLVIREAEEELAKEGVTDASDRAKIVSVLGALPKALAAELRNGGVRMNHATKRDLAVRVAPPTLFGGGLLFLIIEKLLG